MLYTANSPTYPPTHNAYSPKDGDSIPSDEETLRVNGNVAGGSPTTIDDDAAVSARGKRLVAAVSAGVKGLLEGRTAAANACRELVSAFFIVVCYCRCTERLFVYRVGRRAELAAPGSRDLAMASKDVFGPSYPLTRKPHDWEFLSYLVRPIPPVTALASRPLTPLPLLLVISTFADKGIQLNITVSCTIST